MPGCSHPLDANWGYWQTPMAPSAIPYTAFTCHKGLFEFVRMPFGLMNAPATFQRALDIILAGYKWQTCLVYLDDVIVFSKTYEEHLTHLDQVLTALKGAGVTLQLRKCEFFTDRIKYLGHIIRPGTLEVEEAATRCLRDVRQPTTPGELRSFLGLCNVYRRFVRSYTDIAAPLYELLKGPGLLPKELPPFSEKQERAYRALIKAVTEPPVLALPKPGLHYSIDTDACNHQVGCALFQTYENNVRKPLGFWSRTLNKAEKNYSPSEREGLAIVFAIKICRPYIQGTKFTIYTDHQALRWLMEITDPSGRLMRWRLRLAEYDFDVWYKKGNINCQGDCMSRLHSDSHTVVEVDDEIPSFLIDHSDGNEIESIFEVDEALPDPPEALQIFDILLSKPRILYVKGSTKLSTTNKLPSSHSAKTGYLFAGRTSRGASNVCDHTPPILLAAYGARLPHLRAGLPRVRARANQIATLRKPLRLFPPKGPLQDVAIDLLGPLQKSARGHTHLLVISDRFTKLTKTVPLFARQLKAWDVAKAFVVHWVFCYGPPVTLLSDNGPPFDSKFMQKVCIALGVRNNFTTTYHPRANGQVERYNRTILSALRRYVAEHPQHWDLFTDALTFAYNAQVHSSTGLTPFELVLSRPPHELSVAATANINAETPFQSREKWFIHLSGLIKTNKTALDKAQSRYKKNFDDRLRRIKHIPTTG
eukprot:IDg13936t1